jgi:uncharacterized protein (TIGR00369 family)
MRNEDLRNFAAVAADYEDRVRLVFLRQPALKTLGARLIGVAPGRVEIELDFKKEFTQQHGYLHAGIVTTIADSACGYAAYSLMPPGSGVLTVEYKVNFISPAQGAKFVATGRVLKPGRTLTVCAGEVVAINGDDRKSIAIIQATMMRLPA